MDTPIKNEQDTPKHPARIGWLCVLLFILFAFPLVTPRAGFYRWDTWIYLWPLLLDMQQQWMSGHIPFWASDVCAGTPLLANINAAALYPLRIIHFLVPLPFGYNLFVLAHLALSFYFTWVWIRKGLKCSRQGAMLAAMVYCFSGYARGMWDTHNFTVMPWIPLLFAALTIGVQPLQTRRMLLWAGVAWTMMILCGDTQQAVLAGLAGAAYCAFQPQRRIRFAVLLIGVAIGALLCAPQWVPTWHTVQESYRASGLAFSDAVERSFHPVRALEFFIPYLFGTHETWHVPALFGEGASRITPWSASHYVGLLTWVLAVAAFRRRKLPVLYWSLGVIAVASLLGMGRFIPGFSLWQQLPLIDGFRYPEKYLFWLPVGFAVLAGIGHDEFLKLSRNESVTKQIFTTGIACFAILFMTAAWWSTKHGVPVEWTRNHLLFALISVVLLLLPVRVSNRSMALLGVLLFQLLIPWHQEHPLSIRMPLQEAPPVAQIILQSNDPQGRFIGDTAVKTVPMPSYWNTLSRESERKACYYGASLRFNTARLWGLRTADGFSPLEQEQTRRYRLAQGRPLDGSVPDAADFVQFIRNTGTRWVLTTPRRWERFQALGLKGELVRYWNPSGDMTVLIHLDGPRESGPIPARLDRPAPGRMELHLTDGVRYPLHVAESASAGWTIQWQNADPMSVSVGETGFIQIDSPQTDKTLTLSYQQAGWSTGLQMHLAGWALLASCLLYRRRQTVGRTLHRGGAIPVNDE